VKTITNDEYAQLVQDCLNDPDPETEIQRLQRENMELRRQRDEARGMRMKAEFWSKHCPWKPGCGPVSRDGVMTPCTDPGHDWTDEQWQEAAKTA
jgi:hypothetical protein